MANRLSEAALERRAIKLADHLDRIGIEVASELVQTNLSLQTLDTLEQLISMTIYKKAGQKTTPKLMRSFLLAAITKPENAPLVFAPAPTTKLNERARAMAAQALLENDSMVLAQSEALMKDYVQKQVDSTQRKYRRPLVRHRLILSTNACAYCRAQVEQVAREGFFKRHKGCACQMVEVSRG